LTRKARDVKKALTTKGFREEERDHHYYFFYHNGKKSSVHTKISMGQTDISRPLCAMMARQVRLSSAEFGKFLDCTLSAEAYATAMISGGHVVPASAK
jgi:hypothetical protein